MENECRIEVGPPIISILPEKIFALYYKKGLKASIFSQLGSSDTWVSSPITVRNLFRYYFS